MATLVPAHDHDDYADVPDLAAHLALVHGRPVEVIPDNALGHIHSRCHRYGITEHPPEGA
jgi:hypothetical protein